MISPEILDKLDNLVKATRQSNQARNNGEVFVREVLRRAKEAKLTDVVPPEQIEGLAAEAWIKLLVRSKAEYPLDIMEIATQRRNHKLMLKLLRHPDDTMRTYAADQFQMTFAMLDGYYDEASSLVNQILIQPTEIPAVKSALLSDMVMDRMISLVGEDDEPSEYFLSAGVEYLQSIVQYEPTIVEWLKSLIESYPANHRAIKSLQTFVRRNPDVALEVGLIDRRTHKELTGA